jgi:predicted transposase YbfD/YdcC
MIKGIFRRTVKGNTTESIRYYISTLRADAVERVGHFVRFHWGIENGLHWILDVSMGEDGNRTRRDNGAENLSMLRRLALGILKQ